MIQLAWAFLKKPKGMVLVAIVAVAVFYVWDRERTIKHLRTELDTVKLNYATCNASLNTQNDIVDNLADRTKKLLSDERKRVREEIENQQKSNQQSIARLRAKSNPQTCEQAMNDLLKEAHKELKWSN